ncbi:MAG: DUF4913 domain-containing protein [Corynebacteriales bacterium]|nr:DUF4913 domain-containing protein [Mycobacteriales bacterium]
MAEPTGPEREEDIERLVNLIQTQQETIDYLVQYIERVEAQLNDRIDAAEQAAPAAGGGGGGGGAGGGPTPVDWSSISGPKRLKAWHDLSNFVEGVVQRFSIQLEILPCWWQHGDAVEELTALWQARNVAFVPGADASMASWWQDLLERSRMRLRGIFTSCRDGHVPAQHGVWMNDEMRSAFRDAVEAEAEAFGK